MATANDVLAKIKEISLLYTDKRPVLHIDSLIGQLHIPKANLNPLLEELAAQKLIKFHPSTPDLFMLTDEGKKYNM